MNTKYFNKQAAVHEALCGEYIYCTSACNWNVKSIVHTWHVTRSLILIDHWYT
jgi:hypothetical protein